MPEQFLYRYTPGARPELGRGAKAWTDADWEVYERHAAHLSRGAEEGIVILAGRSQDWVGPAIVIVETEDEHAARRFMEADPFVAEGLFGAELHPFKVAFARASDP